MAFLSFTNPKICLPARRPWWTQSVLTTKNCVSAGAATVVETVRFNDKSVMFVRVVLGILIKVTKGVLGVFAAALPLGAGTWAVVWVMGLGMWAGG